VDYAIPTGLEDVLSRQAVVPRIFGPGPRGGIDAFQPPPFPRMYPATAEYGEADIVALAAKLRPFVGRLRPWIAPPTPDDPRDALNALNVSLVTPHRAPHGIDPALHMPALADLVKWKPADDPSDMQLHPAYTEAEVAMRRPSRKWMIAVEPGQPPQPVSMDTQ